MQEERLAMSQQERDWLKTLSEAKGKQITQRQAAERLGVSQRHVVAAVRQHEAALLSGALLVIDEARSRLRLLPITR